MFITTRVILELKSPAMGIIILYTFMFAVIAERP